jgi:aminopeptidase YwaD
MNPEVLADRAAEVLNKLCLEIPGRSVGSPGNREAAAYFAKEMAALGLDVECREFDCIDWHGGDVRLEAGGEAFEALASPYSLGCQARAPLAVAATVDELEASQLAGKILLLQGEIAAEQLMPKNFEFYNPDHHQHIVRLLEEKAPIAIVAATSMNPGIAGALYPFPLIEDGDFDIPSVYMKDVDGKRLAQHAGQEVSLEFEAERLPAKGHNVVARKGGDLGQRVVACAHIDAKAGTPGALDNASGVTILLLLAELMQDYAGDLGLEMVALNGEDYYAAPGEMLYLKDNEGKMDEILLAINSDGAGYKQGNSVYSLYGCPAEITSAIHTAFSGREGVAEGPPWYQSDHSVFIQQGRPALAITSDQLDDLWTRIAHTEQDRPENIDPGKLVVLAQALRDLVLDLDRTLS